MIVATVNAALAEVSAAAIRAGKHVLVEKPAGVSVRQIDELIALVENTAFVSLWDSTIVIIRRSSRRGRFSSLA